MPNVYTFDEARKLHNPPPLITYVEFSSGAGRATLSAFDHPWRAVGTLGTAAVTTVATPRVEGSKANKVTWNANNALTIIATTLSTGLNLASLETLRFFVRSDKTGLPMRVGLGEASAGEYLPEVAAIVTANVFLERTVALDAVVPASKDAIKKLRLELYGRSGVGTTVSYFDNMHAVSRARYANIFQAKPGVLIPQDNFDVSFSAEAQTTVSGHAMDDTTTMDGSAAMDGSSSTTITGGGASTEAVDLSGQNSLSVAFQINAAPATLRFGFGEATYSEHTYNFAITTAGANVTKVFDISAVTASLRDAVRYFAVVPLSVPTTAAWVCSMNSLLAQRYFSPSPIVPYRVFKEKLINIQPITHSIGPVQAPARISNTSLRLANHDSEFYRLRDDNPVLNRDVNIFVGFHDFPDNESQVAMRGVVRGDTVDDEAYEVQVEDYTKKLMVDLPPNVIQDRQYVFPENIGAGSAIWTEEEVPGWSRPHNQHLGRPIPMAFGHCFVPLYLIHRGFWVGSAGFSAEMQAWKFLDETYGSAKEVVRVFRGTLSNEYHQFGTKYASVASVRAFTNHGVFQAGFVANVASGLIYIFGDDAEGGGITTGGHVVPHYAEIRGYADDSNGQWTGTPGTTIQNPSDVTRFMLMNVLKLDASEVNLTDLDASRTSLAPYPVSRAIVKRETAFDLLGGRSSQGGLASNVFAYFFASNVDGKLKIVPANTSVVTSGTYRSTGMHANIIRSSYKVRSQPERIVTRIEVDTGYNVASASDHSFVAITDTQAESYAGANTKEALRIAGKWLPNDVNILTVRYVGTANTATATILGEGEDTAQTFRLTVSNTAQSFAIDLTGASGNTISRLKQTLAAKSFLTATVGNAVSSALDSRLLRAVANVSIATNLAVPTRVGRIKFGYGKMLAWSYLDYYNHNRNAVSWRAPWIGYQQELTQYVDVRSLGESAARTVKILQTRRDPISGTVDFVGEESD